MPHSLSLSLSHTHTHNMYIIHTVTYTHTRGGVMVVQVYDPQHSGFQLLKRGPSVARMCEAVATRVVTQPGQAPAVAQG